MRINLSPIHSDPFSMYPLSSVLCAQSYHVVASRAPTDAARHGAGQLLFPAVIGQDVSPHGQSGEYFSWQMTNICRWSDLSITCVSDYDLTPFRWKLEVTCWSASEGSGFRHSGCFQFFSYQLRFSALYEVHALLERCSTTSDKSNQAWMTHSRYNGNSRVSWRV